MSSQRLRSSQKGNTSKNKRTGERERERERQENGIRKFLSQGGSKPSTSSQNNCTSHHQDEEEDDSSNDNERMEQEEESVDEDYVKKAVRYILLQSRKTPIKRAEIIKNAFPGVRSNFKVIFKHVCKVLLEVYGLEIQPLSTGNDYIILNKLPYVEDDIKVEQGKVPEDSEKVLITLVLAHVFMENKQATVENIFQFLNALGIEKNHVIFGDVNNFVLNKMMKEQYLTLSSEDPEKRSVHWGPRAELEVPKHDILKFVCDVYEDFTPNSWKEHYKLAEEQNGFEVQTQIVNGNDSITID